MFVNNINVILLAIFTYYANGQFLDLRAGKKCLWKGVNGTCVNVYKCPRAKHDISNSEYPPICAYEGKEPVVCCTDCNTLGDRDMRDQIFNPQIGILWKLGSRAENKFNEYLDELKYPCKLHRTASITWRLSDWDDRNCYQMTETHSGFSTDGVTYPRRLELMHTVLLGYGDELTAQWQCGGSIISENFILTSANCTASPDMGSVKFVVIGTLNNSALPDPWQWYRVKRVIVHPQYQPSSKYHDIALVETVDPILFSDQVLPISIIAKNDFRSAAISWNELGHGKIVPDTLESVSVSTLKKYNEQECSLFYPPQPELLNGYNHTIQTCYGFVDKLDVCEGDKGASAQTSDDTTCAYAVLGVTSIGRTCGEAGSSALYTRVSFYQPWIESIVWPEQKSKNVD